MKKLFSLLLICLFIQINIQAQKNSKMDSTSYSIGVIIAQNLKNQGVAEIDAPAMVKAVDDVLKNKPLAIPQEKVSQIFQSYMQGLEAKKHESQIKEGADFLAENAKKPGVVTLPSGLQYTIMTEGTGPKPVATDKVTTHYHGTLIDGTVFDSSVQRGQPATFPVNGVIQGWVEALQMMPTGSKWKLFVPYNLAYGERAAGNLIKPFSTLIFEVELLEIHK